MKILTNNELQNSDTLNILVNKYINNRKHKSKLNVIFYIAVLILCIGIFFNRVITNNILNMGLLLCMLVCIFLIVDSFRELLNLIKASKNTNKYDIITGILKARTNGNEKSGKINYFIDDRKIYVSDNFSMKEFNPYVGKSVNGYFIGEHLILLETI